MSSWVRYSVAVYLGLMLAGASAPPARVGGRGVVGVVDGAGGPRAAAVVERALPGDGGGVEQGRG